MIEKAYFITGTDTEVGKTRVTAGLLQLLSRQGFKVAGMKPVAAGCEWRDGQWKNEDALMLQENATVPLAYDLVNPYAFQLPVSPHLAGNGQSVEMTQIQHNLNQINQQVDLTLVEGAGGWFSPLSERFNNQDLAEYLNLPVILVVAIRLGCINQALLSWQAIQSSKVPAAGWVAVKLDKKMVMADENIQFLQQKISMPLLATVPYCEQAEPHTISKYLRFFEN